MQSSTGQYSTHAGEPAQPVQHSVITASSFGFFFRGVARPLDRGSNFWSSGTIPTALVAPGAGGMRRIIPQERVGFYCGEDASRSFAPCVDLSLLAAMVDCPSFEAYISLNIFFIVFF